ncbi:MAG: phosphotransferase family protein, partial [Deltaproteobacteria bacterium]
RLAAFLRAQGLPAEELSQQQFPKGHSNLTYLVGAGGREFVLRRPPVGSKVRSAHDMGREARILLKLQPVFPLPAGT